MYLFGSYLDFLFLFCFSSDYVRASLSDYWLEDNASRHTYMDTLEELSSLKLSGSPSQTPIAQKPPEPTLSLEDQKKIILEKMAQLQPNDPQMKDYKAQLGEIVFQLMMGNK
jgi:hypothetical protein